MKKIQGSAGTQKAAASRAPTTAPDTLNSKQFASLQDLLSEGEIEGSATASKAGLVKGTPAYNNAFLKDIFLVYYFFQISCARVQYSYNIPQNLYQEMEFLVLNRLS